MPVPVLAKVPTIVLALIIPVVALVTVLITLNATSDGTNETAAGTAISIKNFQFSPNPIAVKAGTAVAVTNDDGTVHTLTADDATFDTGDLNGGAKASVTIAKPGTYAYHCGIHNYMTGTIEAR